LVAGLKNPEHIIIEDHDPVIEIGEVTDPEEVREKQHPPVDGKPGYLDDRTQERCPEGDDTKERNEEGMDTKKGEGPDKREK
jgi:hypothetical protein